MDNEVTHHLDAEDYSVIGRAQLRAAARWLQNVYLARYGHDVGLKHWARDTRYQSPTPTKWSFAGKRLSGAGHAALDVCRIIRDANPQASDTAIAREAAKVLSARPSQGEIVKVVWRAERMPVSVTGKPFADPRTGTITTMISPDRLSSLRRQIETAYGAISVWEKSVVRERDTSAQDPNLIDSALYRQLKRLLKHHRLGQQIS